MRIYRYEKNSFPLCPKCGKSGGMNFETLPNEKHMKKRFQKLYGYDFDEGYSLVLYNCPLCKKSYFCLIPNEWIDRVREGEDKK